VDWTTIDEVCQCGEQFKARVMVRPNGSLGSSCGKCEKCRAVDDYNERKAQAEVELVQVAEDQAFQWLEDSNMPAKFWYKTFANFDKALQPKAFEATRNLQWQWDDADENPPKSLVLLSPGVYGVGKTHLVCALANQIIETERKAFLRNDLYIQKCRCPVYFATETELLRRIRMTFGNNATETEADVYRELSRLSLLIIDDVGKVRPRDLNFLQGAYFGIIDSRYNEQQPVVLTTNLGFADLEAHIGGACADRLMEMAGAGGFVKMTGKSYRGKEAL